MQKFMRNFQIIFLLQLENIINIFSEHYNL